MLLEKIPPTLEFEQFLPPVEGGIALEQETKIVPDARRDISTLSAMVTGEFIKASNGDLYSHPFGRDTEHVIDFSLSSLRAVASDGRDHSSLESRLCPVIEQGISSLVAHIGTKDELHEGKWRRSGQARGKMFHEAGKIESPLMAALAENWQDSDEEDSGYLTYYGSVDATPLFVCIVGDYDQYVREHKSPEAANTFLNKEIAHHNGKDKITIGEAVVMSTGWIMSELGRSDLGFIEYQRHPGQEKGIRNQVMKDSLTSYVHKNGELANTNAPIASIEVQAMAYDALLDAADMFERAPEVAAKQQVSAEAITNMRQEAAGLRERILESFWIADEQRFAQAIDRDPNTATPRRVETPTSNELELLDSRLLHDVEEAKQQQYVTSLARQAMSAEFLTEAGIRSRAKSQYRLVDFNDYHGSGTAWPVITHRVGNGLLGWGFNELAEQVDIRALNAINIGDDRNELFLVDPVTDEVFYRYITKQQADELGETNGILIVGTNIPEEGQAWSEQAAKDIKTKIGAGIYKKVNSNRPEWIAELQREIMAGIEQVSVIKPIKEIQERRRQSPLAIVDIIAGKAADARYYQLADAAIQAA